MHPPTDGDHSNKVDAARFLLAGARLAALGAFGLLIDTPQALVGGTRRLLQQAEARGQKLEDNLLKRYHFPEEESDQARARSETRAAAVGHNGIDKQSENGASAAVDDEVERQVKVILARLGIPNRNKLRRLESDIDEMIDRVDRQLQHSNAKLAGMLPIPDYDSLTAKEILAHIDSLDVEDLNAVRAYEKVRGGRVTLLRELDNRISAFSGADSP